MREDSERLDRWEHRAEWPLAAAALVFIVAYSIDVLVQPRGVFAAVVGAVTWLTWLLFAIDYVIRLSMAPDRKRWFIRHLVDLGIVVLPFFRPLRLVRLIVLVGALQKAVGNAIRGKVIMYTISGAVVLVYVSSLAVLDAERPHPEAHIEHFGDALWWSITTITTVGYGDMYPVTTSGRIVAAMLMVGGISLVGSITATFASWIVERVDETHDRKVASARQVEELRDEVRRLTEIIQRERGAPD